ncbi:hypothetical protein [Roseivivax marinus]|uniref:hypothetical protein n=1 Tax=Roseivivax marinus TaxID=1379903 RepID=UPI00273FF424|nr:hypothetical protein [Roseivivax marinus]
MKKNFDLTPISLSLRDAAQARKKILALTARSAAWCSDGFGRQANLVMSVWHEKSGGARTAWPKCRHKIV